MALTPLSRNVGGTAFTHVVAQLASDTVAATQYVDTVGSTVAATGTQLQWDTQLQGYTVGFTVG